MDTTSKEPSRQLDPVDEVDHIQQNSKINPEEAQQPLLQKAFNAVKQSLSFEENKHIPNGGNFDDSNLEDNLEAFVDQYSEQNCEIQDSQDKNNQLDVQDENPKQVIENSNEQI